jgi:hypothetical protein
MKRSNAFLAFLAVGLALFGLMFVHAAVGRRAARSSLEAKTELVRRLRTTDLCLFTEARYTRHPVMADVNTPFQDHPVSIEHYTSGSLMPPPALLALER